MINGNSNDCGVAYGLNLQIDPGAFASMVLIPTSIEHHFFEIADAATEEDSFLSTTEFYDLAPANTITMRASATASWRGDATASYNIAELQCSLLAIAITI